MINDEKFKKEARHFLNSVCNMTDEEREAEIIEHYDDYLPSIPAGMHKQKLLMKIYEDHIKEFESISDEEAIFYESDIRYINKAQSIKEKRLLFSLVCQYKFHYHNSGWINLQFPNLLKYGFPEKAIKDVKLENFSKCTRYGLEARVIGSASPIVCFSLPLESDGAIFRTVSESETLKFFDEVFVNAAN